MALPRVPERRLSGSDRTRNRIFAGDETLSTNHTEELCPSRGVAAHHSSGVQVHASNVALSLSQRNTGKRSTLAVVCVDRGGSISSEINDPHALKSSTGIAYGGSKTTGDATRITPFGDETRAGSTCPVLMVDPEGTVPAVEGFGPDSRPRSVRGTAHNRDLNAAFGMDTPGGLLGKVSSWAARATASGRSCPIRSPYSQLEHRGGTGKGHGAAASCRRRPCEVGRSRRPKGVIDGHATSAQAHVVDRRRSGADRSPGRGRPVHLHPLH